MKLNLGSGKDYKEGYVNVDWNKDLKADVYADLSKRFPFKDNSVDECYCRTSFEHIPDPINFINEVCRVLKKGGKFIFRVPLANTQTAYSCLEHCNFFTPRAFQVPYSGYDFKFSKKKMRVTLPLLHERVVGFTLKFPYQFYLINKFVEIFTGLEGEFTK